MLVEGVVVRTGVRANPLLVSMFALLGVLPMIFVFQGKIRRVPSETAGVWAHRWRYFRSICFCSYYFRKHRSVDLFFLSGSRLSLLQAVAESCEIKSGVKLRSIQPLHLGDDVAYATWRCKSVLPTHRMFYGTQIDRCPKIIFRFISLGKYMEKRRKNLDLSNMIYYVQHAVYFLCPCFGFCYLGRAEGSSLMKTLQILFLFFHE